jgi:secondary thiamine-phosphate synthase enzyme
MKQIVSHIERETSGIGLVDITGEVVAAVGEANIRTGLATLFCRHTSASLIIQENADPNVVADLEAWFAKAVPEGPGLYRHDEEGPDDPPSHIRTALTGTSLAIPIEDGKLTLGTWQGIFLFEHRTGPRRRDVVVHVIGE